MILGHPDPYKFTIEGFYFVILMWKLHNSRNLEIMHFSNGEKEVIREFFMCSDPDLFNKREIILT